MHGGFDDTPPMQSVATAVLSDEQRRKIHVNKQEALRRRRLAAVKRIEEERTEGRQAFWAGFSLDYVARTTAEGRLREFDNAEQVRARP